MRPIRRAIVKFLRNLANLIAVEATQEEIEQYAREISKICFSKDGLLKGRPPWLV
jgi:hypothetical protein